MTIDLVIRAVASGTHGTPGRVRCERPAPPTSHTVAAPRIAHPPIEQEQNTEPMFREPFTSENVL